MQYCTMVMVGLVFGVLAGGAAQADLPSKVCFELNDEGVKKVGARLRGALEGREYDSGSKDLGDVYPSEYTMIYLNGPCRG